MVIYARIEKWMKIQMELLIGQSYIKLKFAVELPDNQSRHTKKEKESGKSSNYSINNHYKQNTYIHRCIPPFGFSFMPILYICSGCYERDLEGL